jgi:hypothetical protein
MKYYASENHVSTVKIDGGIEITEIEYLACIEALTSGLEVLIIDGKIAIVPKRPSDKHEWIGGEWVDTTPEPEPETDTE